MKIVADYKKRKELKEYLPHEDHWKLKSQDKDKDRKPPGQVLAQLSPNSASALDLMPAQSKHLQSQCPISA